MGGIILNEKRQILLMKRPLLSHYNDQLMALQPQKLTIINKQTVDWNKTIIAYRTVKAITPKLTFVFNILDQFRQCTSQLLTMFSVQTAWCYWFGAPKKQLFLDLNRISL
jgi:hypothetical protein